jgi:hypothetical protein
MKAGKLHQLEIQLSYVRQKMTECDEISKSLPAFDGDAELRLVLENKKVVGLFIYPQDVGVLVTLFESLREYYALKVSGFEAHIAHLKNSDTKSQQMPI